MRFENRTVISKLVIYALVCLVSLMFWSTSEAHTVTPKNNDTDSIQSAIESLGPEGGTVYLPPGVYSGCNSIELPSNVELIGDGPGATIIKLDAPVYAIKIGDSDSSSKFENITVSKLTILGQDIKKTGYGGITAVNMYDSKIVDVHFKNLGEPAIQFNSSPNNIIRDNIFSNNFQGMRLTNESRRNKISGNTIQGCIIHAVFVELSRGNIFTGNNIFTNHPEDDSDGGDDKHHAGISMDQSDSTVIAGNTFNGNGNWHVYTLDSTHTSITGNTFDNSLYYGVQVYRSPYATISGNSITKILDFGGAAISVKDRSDYCSITGNTISENAGEGIVVTSSDFVSIGNNTIHDNRANGISLQTTEPYVGDPDVESDPTPRGHTIVGNVIRENTLAGISITAAKAISISGNSIINNGEYGIGVTKRGDSTIAPSHIQIVGNTIQNLPPSRTPIITFEPFSNNQRVDYCIVTSNNLNGGSSNFGNGTHNKIQGNIH